METHPTTSLLPHLDEEELAALAQDIEENGLLQHIILDPQGRILDGRGRLAACRRAGVEPTFLTYEHDNADAYVLSVNLRRRNLTKSQTAMITVRVRSLEEQDGRSPREQTARSLGEQLGVATAVMGRASTVLQHAPDLVDPVINGAIGLNEAYAKAQENKAKANSAETQLAKLREEDPELANRVAEGELSLAGAWAERRERVEEEKRQRRVATHLLCEILPSLAQVRGTRTFALYDPDLAPPGRAVTREVIEHAARALAEAASVWAERDLP
ncbi:ParB N-terminal domain-containing protein [Streptomyces sp. NBC_01022]|nr:ParB N-terminal domain-containing protein [Streptomyces sp. NBC_01022]WRZ87383.1 ParB N-terminal domain-containing protein [Streptomyces sp. NBC_01022]